MPRLIEDVRQLVEKVNGRGPAFINGKAVARGIATGPARSMRRSAGYGTVTTTSADGGPAPAAFTARTRR